MFGAVRGRWRGQGSPLRVERIGGHLHKIVPVRDGAGNIVSYALKPVMWEFRPRDVMQIIVGASVPAVPVAFTEETWVLGERLPLENVLGHSAVSVAFIALFVYHNFYRDAMAGHVSVYVKRVLAVYILSLVVVGSILTLMLECPWGVDNILAFKRGVIVAFTA